MTVLKIIHLYFLTKLVAHRPLLMMILDYNGSENWWKCRPALQVKTRANLGPTVVIKDPIALILKVPIWLSHLAT